MKLSEELAWRGFVNQTTLDKPTDVDGEKKTFYWGVDPTAESMTIGNLAAAMMVRHFIEHGHKAVLLVGGATGLIGDPDGKSQERELISNEQLEKNKKKIVEQYKTLFKGLDFEVVDNLDWFSDMKYVNFLRDVGKHVPMRQMLNREFVTSRVKEGGAGLSYAEFSYVMIQAYDFVYLNKEKGVTLQLCGADQWGNSIAGVDLVRRMNSKRVDVWSAPLVVNKSTGVKFGKTEGGAIWLDSEKTTSDDFYQFWFNTDDGEVEKYLKIFTLLSKEDIESLISEGGKEWSFREPQRELAKQVTTIVHGEDAFKKAVQHAHDLSASPSLSAPPDVEAAVNDSIIDVLCSTELVKSKSDARRLIDSGGVYINDVQVKKDKIEKMDFKDGRLKLRRGKTLRNTVLVQQKK